MLRLHFKKCLWCAHLHLGMLRHQTMSTATAQDECNERAVLYVIKQTCWDEVSAIFHDITGSLHYQRTAEGHP